MEYSHIQKRENHNLWSPHNDQINQAHPDHTPSGAKWIGPFYVWYVNFEQWQSSWTWFVAQQQRCRIYWLIEMRGWLQYLLPFALIACLLYPVSAISDLIHTIWNNLVLNIHDNNRGLFSKNIEISYMLNLHNRIFPSHCPVTHSLCRLYFGQV